MRRLVTSLAVGAAALSLASPVSAATDPSPEQAPDATVPVGVDDSVPVATSTTLPPGCEKPAKATAVFVGEVTAKDSRTARFQVVQVRAGSLKGFQVSGLVDVDYFDDVRYLEVGEQYIIGAAKNSISDRLSSAVREPAPLFGGNQVVGVNDSDVDCPVFEDPVRTLMLDGSSVESGVFAPFTADKKGIARALLMPTVWLFLGLLAVAAIKDLLWASGREVYRMIRRRDPLVQPAPRRSHNQRRRQHASQPPRR